MLVPAALVFCGARLMSRSQPSIRFRLTKDGGGYIFSYVGKFLHCQGPATAGNDEDDTNGFIRTCSIFFHRSLAG